MAGKINIACHSFNEILLAQINLMITGFNMKVLVGVQGIAIACAALAMTGCAGNMPGNGGEVVIVPQVSVGEELKDISIEARDELRLLAKAKEAMAQKSMTPDQQRQEAYQSVTVPQGFEKRVQFKYYGRASEAAKAIGAVAGYTVKIEGKAVPNEPFVSIRTMNAPLNDALRELGMQTGEGVRIEIHQSEKLMRFVYKNQ
jgi:predicted RNA-binding protein with TRAM domain